LCTLRNA